MSSYLYCGTPRGIYDHNRDGESCKICKDYWITLGKPKIDEKILQTATRKHEPKKRGEAVCGTESGYRKHKRNDTEPCEACREAYRIAASERNSRRPKATGHKETVHGTNAGAQWHYREKVPLCEPCQEAKNAYQRETRAVRRAKRKVAQ